MIFDGGDTKVPGVGVELEALCGRLSPHPKSRRNRDHGNHGGEGGIPTHAILRYPTLSAVTKSLYLKHLQDYLESSSWLRRKTRSNPAMLRSKRSMKSRDETANQVMNCCHLFSPLKLSR